MPRRKITEDPVLRETKCYICGRVFVPAPQHVFHRSGKWCCKWSCFSRLLDEIEAKKKKAGRPKKKKFAAPERCDDKNTKGETL